MSVSKIGNVSIHHREDFYVIFITNDTINLTQLLISETKRISIAIDEKNPFKSELVFPESLEELIRDLFKITDKVRNKCLQAYVCTHIYECMTLFWVTLRQKGQHISAIVFWRKIVEITTNWEQETKKHIHKGSLYAFLANAYLMIGQFDTGFSFIYNAIEEDIELNKKCPSLNYPKKAPVYLTASLSSKTTNIMQYLVEEIRSELDIYLNNYRTEFHSSLSMNDLDTKFLQNNALETIKYFFVFTLWSIVNYKTNIESKLMKNDFSKLRNATWFFALCLVIDELLGNKAAFKVKNFGRRIIKYICHKKLMSQTDVENIYGKLNISKGDPDQILPILLSAKLKYNKKIVPKEIQHLFVALNLRNFAGHEIKTKKVFIEQFENILKFLLFDIFLIIEEY